MESSVTNLSYWTTFKAMTHYNSLLKQLQWEMANSRKGVTIPAQSVYDDYMNLWWSLSACISH